MSKDSQELRDAVAARQEKITRLQLGPGHAAKCRAMYEESFRRTPVGGRHPYVLAQEERK